MESATNNHSIDSMDPLQIVNGMILGMIIGSLVVVVKLYYQILFKINDIMFIEKTINKKILYVTDINERKKFPHTLGFAQFVRYFVNMSRPNQWIYDIDDSELLISGIRDADSENQNFLVFIDSTGGSVPDNDDIICSLDTFQKRGRTIDCIVKK